MKYVNDWFNEENYLDLTRNLKDRRVTLKQDVVWTDGNQAKVFDHETNFVLLKEANGDSPRPSDNIVSKLENGPVLGEFSEKEEFKLDGEEKM